MWRQPVNKLPVDLTVFCVGSGPTSSVQPGRESQDQFFVMLDKCSYTHQSLVVQGFYPLPMVKRLVACFHEEIGAQIG